MSPHESALFRPVTHSSELPKPGATEGPTLDFKGNVPADWTEFRLAWQMAAFANSAGGTLLIGAIEEGERLKRYLPRPELDIVEIERRYQNAARDHCSPGPLVMPSPIEIDGGWVLAVNVWPFPGQVVGVRALTTREVDGKQVATYAFPLRVGRGTVEIRPEQLPMLMLPEIRRTAILLSSIPADVDVTVSGHTYHPKTHQMRIESLELLANTLTLQMTEGTAQLRVWLPLDHVEMVWREADAWRIHVRGQIKIDGGRLAYDLAQDDRRTQKK